MENLHISGSFRRFFGGSKTLVVTDDRAVLDILNHLAQDYPEADNLLFDKLKPRSFYRVFINQRMIHEDGYATEVAKEGDDLFIFPPISGG